MYPHIRHATAYDVERILEIARQYRSELGYVHPVALRKNITARTVLVVEWFGSVWGFVDYHARRDGWHTIYHIAVDKHMAGQGLGRNLLYAVPTPMRLKVTQDNAPANAFYLGAGMRLAATETGKARALNVYELRVLGVLVMGNGKGDTFPRIARASGWAYGTRHCEQARDWPFMVDIHWRDYEWQDYLHKLAQWRPVQAMVADYESPAQRRQLYRQIRDVRANNVLRVMVCPKFAGAVAHIPSWCIVAVSVPSKYAGYVPPLHELRGRRVHLLGGSPVQQCKWQVVLQGAGALVASADGNSHQRKAQQAGWWDGAQWQVIGARSMRDGEYEQLMIDSGRNIVKMLNANVDVAQLSLPFDADAA
jgi:GNAT superfamily N-acetyltransferase